MSTSRSGPTHTARKDSATHTSHRLTAIKILFSFEIHLLRPTARRRVGERHRTLPVPAHRLPAARRAETLRGDCRRRRWRMRESPRRRETNVAAAEKTLRWWRRKRKRKRTRKRRCMRLPPKLAAAPPAATAKTTSNSRQGCCAPKDNIVEARDRANRNVAKLGRFAKRVKRLESARDTAVSAYGALVSLCASIDSKTMRA